MFHRSWLLQFEFATEVLNSLRRTLAGLSTNYSEALDYDTKFI